MIFVVAVAVAISAQQSKGERQIRGLIVAEENGNAPPRTADRIFWSNAYKWPAVGNEPAPEIPSESQPSNRVPGSTRIKNTIRRIEIAKSGDLAYEFTESEIAYDLESGKRVSFPRSVLRVWRKEAGQWKVAASFSRPHY
jgi:hypothetical protein